MDNGIVRLTFSKPGGDLIAINYNGIDNLLETDNERNNRGYWDIAWNNLGVSRGVNVDKLLGTKFSVIKSDQDQAEISFSRTWNVSFGDNVAPLNVDKRYIVLRNYPGFYTYAIIERHGELPEAEIGQVRIVYKLRGDMFRLMAISDQRQRKMPTAHDRITGKPLAYPEAVLLTDPSDALLRGEVDDKYQYSAESKDNRVQGWISSKPPMGFWMITPSIEFRSDGPVKQELTSHAGPICLSMFTSAHYGGKDVTMKFEKGEAWKKVYGPVSVYLNSASNVDNNLSLWANAKEKLKEEEAKWPYNFPESPDFIRSDQRGSVDGQLLVHDWYISERHIFANSAYVGLAAPGEAGSWQTESKGYQFWAQADRMGHFSIKNVRPGIYSLYAWVPGVIGNYIYDKTITIVPGGKIELNSIVYEAPRNGPTLWEIGIPDRTAAEFYIPDPYPTLINRLYSHRLDKFRQYGLWDRYTDLYRNGDLVFKVGVSNYRRDWFFAHVTRNMGNETYKPTTWQIVFDLENVLRPANYTLQLALASATNIDLQIRINDPNADPPHFKTGVIGRDNAIARHGIHGLYWFYSINLPSYLFRHGSNTIFLAQTKSDGAFSGLMYDYIRLEGPPQT
ncbi:hypothetical protein UlMin_038871 [Ulmus minor]